ncbi:MAG: SET domain-containing protein [Hyphomicrobiaceae bacterium]
MKKPNDETRPLVKVKRSQIGLGLFAQEDIPKGQVVIEYTGERISTDEADRRGGRYLFTVTDEIVIDGKGRENLSRYINHACRPNAQAEHDETDDRIYIRAIRKIRDGEEITYNYGREYLEDLIGITGCKCSACV